MEPQSRETERREVRASVYRICLRKVDGSAGAARGLSEAQITEALATAGLGSDDDEARRWVEEDLADFSRAVLVSELVTRRIGTGAAAKPGRTGDVSERSPAAKRPEKGGTLSVADLLDGMLAQEKKG